jgi:hypothetical protein
MAQSTRERLMHDAGIGVWRYDPDADVYHFSSELSLGHGTVGAPVPTATLQLIQHRDDRAKDAAIRERITREGGVAEGEMRYALSVGRRRMDAPESALSRRGEACLGPLRDVRHQPQHHRAGQGA